jgi:hypothetical protein
MIALILFLFIGGQKKPVSGGGSIGQNYVICLAGYHKSPDGGCAADEGMGDGKKSPDGTWPITCTDCTIATTPTSAKLDFPDAVLIVTKDGVTAVKLSDAEYSHLQTLRKAVVDEEKRLAKKYGAVLSNPASCPPYCATFNGAYVWQPDRYEYHGQFLLIEKGKQ